MDLREVQMGVNVVQSDDLQEFTWKLGEAVAHWSSDGPPSVAFSHAPSGDGFSYAAVVVGYAKPGTKVATRMVEDDES
jgi:hypothetical protein